MIAVAPGTPLGDVTSMKELEEKFPGVLEIVRIWFEHYKVLDNKMKFVGNVEHDEALQLLEASHKVFDPKRVVDGH